MLTGNRVSLDFRRKKASFLWETVSGCWYIEACAFRLLGHP
jgi:hypothetical protein